MDQQSRQEQQELFDRAGFGREVDRFWNSNVGEYLRKRAEDGYKDAIVNLKTVDPTDFKKVASFQVDVAKFENFIRWLSEAISDGIQAELFLQGELDEQE